VHVEFYRHNIGDPEKEKLMECLDGIFLTTGSYVNEFEKNFAEYLKLKHAVGLTSCTAALHLSLLALGVGPGDEVITTPMTFIATATSILHTGATPIFVDVEPDTALIDCSRIEQAITKKTRAIIPVHLYGQMCDMRSIRQIADKYNLKVIEDAAHCIEGERDGYKPGHLGDVACFSFYATKNITSGEGGAIATNNPKRADKVRLLRQHGMSKEACERYPGRYQHWDMVECGWKYNMDNIQAALLLPQLENIEKLWEKRSETYLEYYDQLKPISAINIPRIVDNSKNAFHLFTIWVDPAKRDQIIFALGEHGIKTTVNYRAIHLLTYLKQKYGFEKGVFPISEKIGDSTLSLPFHPNLTRKEIHHVAKTLKNILPG
jgi:UDP-4-amino-4-deoxy-L-arabinose-oxoglutarate aminotransferase